MADVTVTIPYDLMPDDLSPGFLGVPADPGHLAPLDLSRSLVAGARVEAKVGRCWGNALRALCFDGPNLYVEGYGVTDLGIPFEHGWLLRVREGDPHVVVDPTLSAFARAGFAVPARYIPAFVWSATDFLTQAVKEKRVPLSLNCPNIVIKPHGSVREIWHAALVCCFERKDFASYA